ncbi:MAG: NTP transferase domain-containing protein, partial [Muribaculaceae bacterium]|nr:NTP transferase domain-containing protein [Muribaculaceae bacterium]
MTGMIFAAGMGTRLKPWTDHHPKALVPIDNKPMLFRVIDNMTNAGITRIVVNIHHFADQIIESLDRYPLPDVEILISDERARLLDTGGAIVKAAPLFSNEDVLRHTADIRPDLNLGLLIDEHKSNGCDATLLTSTRESSRQLLFDDENRLAGWINHKTSEILPGGLPHPDRLNARSFNGIHVISPRITKMICDKAENSVFGIIPMYVSLCHEAVIKNYTPTMPYKWFDIGKPET